MQYKTAKINAKIQEYAEYSKDKIESLDLLYDEYGVSNYDALRDCLHNKWSSYTITKEKVTALFTQLDRRMKEESKELKIKPCDTPAAILRDLMTCFLLSDSSQNKEVINELIKRHEK